MDEFILEETPPHHHIRPGPSGRASARTSIQRARSERSSPRIHKPRGPARVARPSALPNLSKPRRDVLKIDPEQNRRVRQEYDRLREERRDPPVFVIEAPEIESSGRWRCGCRDDGIQCRVTCKRKTEAERHALTHHTVRWLCGNPDCGILMVRVDSVKRHMQSKAGRCEEKLPPGTTVDSVTPTVSVEGDDVRLVQMKWLQHSG